MKQPPILIIGKNGKIGSRVDRRLRALGHATRPVSRSTRPAFDWNDPATWRPAIERTRAAYVTYQPDLAVPTAESTIKAFVRVAADAGLEHIVLLSGRGEQGAERAEAILSTSGLSWNIVRASWFSQNFSESFMLDGILAGMADRGMLGLEEGAEDSYTRGLIHGTMHLSIGQEASAVGAWHLSAQAGTEFKNDTLWAIDVGGTHPIGINPHFRIAQVQPGNRTRLGAGQRGNRLRDLCDHRSRQAGMTPAARCRPGSTSCATQTRPGR